MTSFSWIASLGTVFAFFSVLGGAFGAHFLRQRLGVEYLAIFETAIRYQMYHAFALMMLASRFFAYSWLLVAAATCFVLGTLLFSGSLYLLIFSEKKAWGMVTPVGGLFLLAGWLFFFLLNLSKAG